MVSVASATVGALILCIPFKLSAARLSQIAGVTYWLCAQMPPSPFASRHPAPYPCPDTRKPRRNMDQVTGSCLCGSVTLIAKGTPNRVGLCHYIKCRKHHGALFFAAAIFPRTAVEIAGETRDYEGRNFCPNCGSSVFALTDD